MFTRSQFLISSDDHRFFTKSTTALISVLCGKLPEMFDNRHIDGSYVLSHCAKGSMDFGLLFIRRLYSVLNGSANGFVRA